MYLTRLVRRNWDISLIVGVFLISLILVTPYLRGDGVGYYSYVSSLIIDGDLDFRNEYSHSDPWGLQKYFDENGNLLSHHYTPTGRITNKFSVGPSLLWSPFFILAHAFVSVHNTIRPENPVPADGFSRPYLLFCSIGTAIYGLAGLLLSYLMARRLFGKFPALVGVLGVWLASSLLVYTHLLPFMSHAFSAFTCSLFVLTWWHSYEERRIKHWVLLGLIAGLMSTIYYVNIIFLCFLLFDLWDVLKAQKVKLLSLVIPLFGLSFIIGALPHFITKHIIYGSPLNEGYPREWFFTSPKLIKVLLSSEHGLWTWTPIVFMAYLGLIPLTRRHKAIGWRSIATFLLFWYVIASWGSWHGQSSFGNRFFISLTPIFILGLAAGVDYLLRSSVPKFLSQKSRIFLVGTIIVLLIIWNLGFILQWATNMIPNRGPISWRKMIYNQFTAVPNRAAHMMGSFFTSRTKLIRKIETEDIEEMKKYRPRR